MKINLTIDRFTCVALCLTTITGIAINKLELVRTFITWLF